VVPVIADPGVDHGVHRNSRLECRMRIEQRHEREEPVVRNAGDADAAVVIGHVLHQPVDGVPGVGRMIDAAAVERASERQIHDVVAFRAVLTADVLVNTHIAVADQRLVVLAHRHRHQRARDLPGVGAFLDVVRRARQHDGHRLAGALRDQDHREQLDAVAHRDHLFTARVVIGIRDRVELRRNVVASDRLYGLYDAGHRPEGACREKDNQRPACGGRFHWVDDSSLITSTRSPRGVPCSPSARARNTGGPIRILSRRRRERPPT